MSNKSQLQTNNSLLSTILGIVSNKQSKEVTAGTEAKTVERSEGGILWTVKVNPTPTEDKTVTPSDSVQTVTPPAGKHLGTVTVEAIPIKSVSGTFHPAFEYDSHSVDNPFGSASKVKAVILHAQSIPKYPGILVEYYDPLSDYGFVIVKSSIPVNIYSGTNLIEISDSTITFNKSGSSVNSAPLQMVDYTWEVIGYE